MADGRRPMTTVYLIISDAFPSDSTDTADGDGDGIGDNADTDDDNDGTADTNDAFPSAFHRDGRC